MRQQYLLIEDVEDVGRKGEVISAKPGFARNFLIPQKKAQVATVHVLRKQAKLQEERAKEAEVDRKAAEELSQKIEGMALKIVVKVDPEGHLYGSVGASDIVALFAKHGVQVEKKNVGVSLHLRTLGDHALVLKLKEGVTCKYTVIVESDHPLASKK